MDNEERRVLKSLLADRRVATLAVLVEGHPFASLVPFAMTEDFGAALIHASRLARHSQGLSTDAPFSLLVHEPDTTPQTNPAQLARVTLQGTVHPYDRDDEAYSARRDLYLAKFPKSRITFQLGDFTLFALQVKTCRLVAGFAKTYDLSPVDLGKLSTP